MPSKMPLAACLYLTSSSSMGRLSWPSMSRDYHVTSYDVVGMIILPQADVRAKENIGAEHHRS